MFSSTLPHYHWHSPFSSTQPHYHQHSQYPSAQPVSQHTQPVPSSPPLSPIYLSLSQNHLFISIRWLNPSIINHHPSIPPPLKLGVSQPNHRHTHVWRWLTLSEHIKGSPSPPLMYSSGLSWKVWNPAEACGVDCPVHVRTANQPTCVSSQPIDIPSKLMVRS